MGKRKLEFIYLIHTLNRIISHDVRLNFFRGENRNIDLIFLSVIDHEPGINLSMICKEVIYDSSFVSKKLSLLKTKDYIYVEKKERITRLYITEKGSNILDEYDRNIREFVKESAIKKDIDTVEMKKNLKTLKNVLKNLIYLIF